MKRRDIGKMPEEKIKIKICGLSRDQDIDFVNELRPDYIGFVFAPKSHRYVTPEQAACLRKRLDPGIVSVGVFVNETPERVASLLEQEMIGMAQLHGQEDEGYIARLRQLTDKPLLQAFRICSTADIEKAVRSKAEYILLDNGAGGTGEAFDWSLLSKIDRPWFLAGGLTPKNVTEALQRAEPRGVDVSSGVETDRVKDYHKIKSFIQNIRNYEETLRQDGRHAQEHMSASLTCMSSSGTPEQS